MLALISGDIHLSGKNPPERKDDLAVSQWKKIEYMIEIANYHGVPIICTGDIFNTPLVSNKIMSTLGEMLNKLHHPFFFVFGNHDLQYHNLDMLDQTSLGVMWMNNNKLKHISEFEKDYGIPWSYIDWRTPFHDPDARFLLAHRAIVNDALVSSNSWVMDDQDFCQSVKELTRYDLIICGHWHRSYEYFYQYSPTKDVHVLNPGVICRRSIVEREDPAVFLLDLEKNEHAVRIDLSAPRADDIMREEGIKESIKPHKEEITKFVEQLRNQQLTSRVSFLDTLVQMTEQLEGQKSVIKEMEDIIVTAVQKKGGSI